MKLSGNSRRNEIIRILRSKNQTTMLYLADALGVSISTIKRDILLLTVDEGYPIDTVQGNRGGVLLRNYTHSHKHILSQEEIKVLTLLMQTVDTYTAEVLIGILKAYA